MRAALWFLRARIGSWALVAKILKAKRVSLRRLRAGESIHRMRWLAVRVSRIVGVDVRELLAGKFPPTGTCPHCGNLATAPSENSH